MSHAETSTAAEVQRVHDECWLELPNSYLPYSVLVAKDHSSLKPGIIPKLHLSSVLVAGVLQNTILERQASVEMPARGVLYLLQYDPLKVVLKGSLDAYFPQFDIILKGLNNKSTTYFG